MTDFAENKNITERLAWVLSTDSVFMPPASVDTTERFLACPELRSVYLLATAVMAMEEGCADVALGLQEAVSGLPPAMGRTFEGEYAPGTMTAYMMGWHLGARMLWACHSGSQPPTGPVTFDAERVEETPEEWIAKWRAHLARKAKEDVQKERRQEQADEPGDDE